MLVRYVMVHHNVNNGCQFEIGDSTIDVWPEDETLALKLAAETLLATMVPQAEGERYYLIGVEKYVPPKPVKWSKSENFFDQEIDYQESVDLTLRQFYQDF